MVMYIEEDECSFCGDSDVLFPTISNYEDKIVSNTACAKDYDESPFVSVCPVDNCILQISL